MKLVIDISRDEFARMQWLLRYKYNSKACLPTLAKTALRSVVSDAAKDMLDSIDNAARIAKEMGEQ